MPQWGENQSTSNRGLLCTHYVLGTMDMAGTSHRAVLKELACVRESDDER